MHKWVSERLNSKSNTSSCQMPSSSCLYHGDCPVLGAFSVLLLEHPNCTHSPLPHLVKYERTLSTLLHSDSCGDHTSSFLSAFNQACNQDFKPIADRVSQMCTRWRVTRAEAGRPCRPRQDQPRLLEF